jgi:hypothetical protein
LREPEDGKVRFVNLTLEDVIEAIRLSDQAHAEALHHRYFDFWLVDGALELNAKRFGLPAKRQPANRRRRRRMRSILSRPRLRSSGASRGARRKRPRRISLPNSFGFEARSETSET